MTLTPEAVQEKISLWIPKVQGQYINEDWNPQNEGFGAQCWDLAANWSKFLGLPVINTSYPGQWAGWAGNMVAAYPQTPEIAAAYELIAPDQPGLAGDIAVWGDSYQAYYPATHVAVLIRDANLQLLCASQNSTSSRADNPYPKWSSGPATIQYLPRRGLIGFLRPRTSGAINYQGTITTPTEEEDVTTPEQIDRIVTATNEGTQAIANQVFERLLKELPPGIWGYKNGEDRDTYQILRDNPKDGWKVPLDYRDPATGEISPQKTTGETVMSFADRHLVLTLDSITASARGIVDAVKAAPQADAAQVAEEAYKAFTDKLSSIKLTIGTEGN